MPLLRIGSVDSPDSGAYNVYSTPIELSPRIAGFETIIKMNQGNGPVDCIVEGSWKKVAADAEWAKLIEAKAVTSQDRITLGTRPNTYRWYRLRVIGSVPSIVDVMLVGMYKGFGDS